MLQRSSKSRVFLACPRFLALSYPVAIDASRRAKRREVRTKRSKERSGPFQPIKLELPYSAIAYRPRSLATSLRHLEHRAQTNVALSKCKYLIWPRSIARAAINLRAIAHRIKKRGRDSHHPIERIKPRLSSCL